MGPSKPSPTCSTCGSTPTRRYYLGDRCDRHAPSEAEIRQAAIDRATRRDSLERERAIPSRPGRETR